MKVFQEKKRQQLKKDDQDKVMRICVHQSKKYNAEKARTYYRLETGNRSISAYLRTCSKIL